jgi:hypothetical protein
MDAAPFSSRTVALQLYSRTPENRRIMQANTLWGGLLSPATSVSPVGSVKLVQKTKKDETHAMVGIRQVVEAQETSSK